SHEYSDENSSTELPADASMQVAVSGYVDEEEMGVVYNYLRSQEPNQFSRYLLLVVAAAAFFFIGQSILMPGGPWWIYLAPLHAIAFMALMFSGPFASNSRRSLRLPAELRTKQFRWIASDSGVRRTCLSPDSLHWTTFTSLEPH